MKTSHTGFTIIELMIVVGILTIIATISLPSFTQTIAKYRFNSNVKELANVLTLARNQATMIRSDVVVNLNSADPNTNTQYNWMPQNNIKTANVSNITFTPDGGVRNFQTNIAIVLCSPAQVESKTIMISRMGTQSVVNGGTC